MLLVQAEEVKDVHVYTSRSLESHSFCFASLKDGYPAFMRIVLFSRFVQGGVKLVG